MYQFEVVSKNRNTDREDQRDLDSVTGATFW
jgi:hypothetical protein